MVNEGAPEAEAALRLVLCNAPPERAKALAHALVERRLAACVNLLPGVESVYRWQGVVEEARETTLFIKTRAELLPALTSAIAELHGYDVPEVVALPLVAGEGNAAYRAWVVGETSAPLPVR